MGKRGRKKKAEKRRNSGNKSRKETTRKNSGNESRKETTSKNYGNESQKETTTKNSGNESLKETTRKNSGNDSQKETTSKNYGNESLKETTRRNSGSESPEETTIYQISDNVKGDLIGKIVEKCINSHGCNVVEGEKKKIIAAIEKDCVAILQRIINASSTLSCKKFTLDCLKFGFNQHGFSDMWNMFIAKNDDFTAQDYANYMEKIKREQSEISTAQK